MATNNTDQKNNNAMETLSTTPTLTTQYLQQQQPTLSNFATSAQSMPQTQQAQTYVAPTIQNANQVPLQPQIIYAQQPQIQPQLVYTPVQPQIANQPQPQVNQNDTIERQLAMAQITNSKEEIQRLKDELKDKKPQEEQSSAVKTLENTMRSDAEAALTQTYNDKKKAEEEQKKEIEDLKAKLKEYEKKDNERDQEKTEENIRQQIAVEYQDQFDRMREENEALKKWEKRSKEQKNLPDEMQKLLQKKQDIKQKKRDEVYKYGKRIEDSLNSLQRELESSKKQLNMENAKISLLKKFLIALNFFDEPET